MSLAVVERFSVLVEAQIARAALESADIPAVIVEENHGLSDPLIHVAIQGFRLCVPAQALDDAVAILRDIRVHEPQAEPSDIAPDRREPGWQIASLLTLPLLGLEAAFLPELFRRRRARILPVALVATPVILLSLAALLFLAFMVIYMITHPPR